MERIKQTSDDDCMGACAAMLTDYTLDEVKDQYDMPMSNSDMIEVLEEEYGHVERTDLHDMSAVGALAYGFESLIITVRSPIRERDTEQFAKVLEDNRRRRIEDLEDRLQLVTEERRQRARAWSDVYHAIVVHKGRLYDPQDPPYWPGIGFMMGDDRYELDYDINSAFICMDEPVVDPDEGLARAPAGYDSYKDLPEYDH